MDRKMIFGLFGLLLLMPAQGQAKESHWVLFGQEKLFDHYYDEANFVRTPDNVIGVWVKVVPRVQEAKDALLESRRLRAFRMEGYEDYEFTVTAIEINCTEKTRTLMESRDYGKMGRILDKVGAVRRNWKPIKPEDHPHAFYMNVLCKKHPK